MYLCICPIGVSILLLSRILIFDFWNCSESVVFFFLHFITTITTFRSFTLTIFGPIKTFGSFKTFGLFKTF